MGRDGEPPEGEQRGLLTAEANLSPLQPVVGLALEDLPRGLQMHLCGLRGAQQKLQRTEPQELCQQVFMKAFEHLHSFDPSRRFFSWIYRVAINESINHLKARRFHEPILDGLEPADGSLSPMETLDDRRQQDLRLALARLEPKYVAVITLFHFLHKSYEEIAETLELPEKTVKSRLYTARQLLRESLEGLGYGH